MRFLILTLALLFCTQAYGQNAANSTMPEGPRCWLGTASFSPGAKIRAGESVMVCTDKPEWVISGGDVAGCWYADDFYSPGAVVKGGTDDIVCQRSGEWSPRG